MTAIIAVLLFGLITVAATVYASIKADEAAHLRVELRYALLDLATVTRHARDENARNGRHIVESTMLLADNDHLQHENIYLRACSVHRRQAVAGGMLQAQLVRPARKLSVHEASNMP